MECVSAADHLELQVRQRKKLRRRGARRRGDGCKSSSELLFSYRSSIMQSPEEAISLVLLGADRLFDLQKQFTSGQSDSRDTLQSTGPAHRTPLEPLAPTGTVARFLSTCCLQQPHIPSFHSSLVSLFSLL